MNLTTKVRTATCPRVRAGKVGALASGWGKFGLPLERVPGGLPANRRLPVDQERHECRRNDEQRTRRVSPQDGSLMLSTILSIEEFARREDHDAGEDRTHEAPPPQRRGCHSEQAAKGSIVPVPFSPAARKRIDAAAKAGGLHISPWIPSLLAAAIQN